MWTLVDRPGALGARLHRRASGIAEGEIPEMKLMLGKTIKVSWGVGMGFGYDFWIEGVDGPIREDAWTRVRDGRDDLVVDPDELARRIVWRRPDREDAYLEWCEPGLLFVAIPVEDGGDVEAMVELAGSLGAEVRGESGEIYRGGGVIEG